MSSEKCDASSLPLAISENICLTSRSVFAVRSAKIALVERDVHAELDAV